MPFKVLNSRTVIIAGERVLSEENSNNLSTYDLEFSSDDSKILLKK